jgi:Rps23 Pro-64 3,4-dihydroxylase Tpa1-like proline 4-hydroxylase
MTGTGDGEYFRMHTDNGSGEVSTRALTFVYFYYREPCPFAGGELQIYDTVFADGEAVADGASHTIVPEQNQVVFFPSHCFHEILPVSSPSGTFPDRRFTVNGWLHV